VTIGQVSDDGGDGCSKLEADAKAIFTKSILSKEPLTTVFFALSEQGEVVHEFAGYPGGGRRTAGNPDYKDYKAEIQKAVDKLDLTKVKTLPKGKGEPVGLPDLKPGTASAAPDGVRIFVRSGGVPIVELVPMKAEQWEALSWTPKGKQIEAKTLKNWLVWLYPAGIRRVDELKRFQKFSGTLKLEPAGSDEEFRYALLRGEIRLAKEGDDDGSAYQGTFHAVLSYRLDGSTVHAVRGVVEGVYLYRPNGGGGKGSPMKLSAAIESRPE
jgi:hypothetical protein